MPNDPFEKVGKRLAQDDKNRSNSAANISPDDSSGQFNFNFSHPLEIRGSLLLRKLFYQDTSFVIDHPVRGEIDSNYYEIDGGYNRGGVRTTPFPLVFPIVFGNRGEEDPTEVIHTSNF